MKNCWIKHWSWKSFDTIQASSNIPYVMTPVLFAPSRLNNSVIFSTWAFTWPGWMESISVIHPNGHMIWLYFGVPKIYYMYFHLMLKFWLTCDECLNNAHSFVQDIRHWFFRLLCIPEEVAALHILVREQISVPQPGLNPHRQVYHGALIRCNTHTHSVTCLT